MSAKQMLYLSMYVKGVIIALLICVITAHRLFSQRWFSSIATTDQIRQDLASEKDAINSYNNIGQTGLMFAIALGDEARVKLLIDAGANVNALSKESPKPLGNTALHIAALKGNATHGVSVEIMKLLLDTKADPLIRNAHGDSVIMFLWYSDFYDRRNAMLDLLLAHGADLNTQNNDGKTLMHQMVDRNDVKWYDQIMPKYGDRINLDLKNKQGLTPLGYAKKLGVVTMQTRLRDAMRKKKKDL